MSLLKTKILNELTYTIVNETNDQKAKRIADALETVLQSIYTEGQCNPVRIKEPEYLSFEDWRKTTTII